MSLTNQPLAYAHTNRSRFLAELKDFIRFPTVSAQPDRASDLKHCAAWLANHLRWIGLKKVQVIPTDGHPLVYAEWSHAPGQPTVLIYGHYDVQPPDPLAEWRSPPFEPVMRGNDLYGRGASDDKGQLFVHIKALEAYLKTTGKLPVNVKCLFEGEEEIGSPHLTAVLKNNALKFAADSAVLSDTSIVSPNQPAITYALRGAISLEMEVCGPNRDLHSGKFGGAVHNPLQALCEIIASLHDSKGCVAVPVFYDRVQMSSAEERRHLTHVGPSDAQMLSDADTHEAWGEHGYTVYERTTIRPSLTINGITGGYQGAGVKAVIPARAVAKLEVRLVPDQEPREIVALFRDHIARITPSTVRTRVRTRLLAQPALVSIRHRAMRAAARAYQKGFGKRPIFLRAGGTIPVVNMFQEVLHISTVLMGFALPDDRLHGPNEKFHLPNFHNGIATAIWFLAELGAEKGSQHDR